MKPSYKARIVFPSIFHEYNFNKEDFDNALKDFLGRKRKFGVETG